MPIMRAMPLMYPKDKKCAELMRQYMFGDYMLVSAFTDKVYLPEGKWIDYWSGEEYTGEQEIKLEIPKGKGGGLFIKGGAIIPEWPYVDYIGQKEIDTLTVQVYPYQKSSFTLIEDQGEGFGYETGQVAETKMVCDASDNEIVFTKSKRAGEYQGMPESRTLRFVFHLSRIPSSVLVDGEEIKDLKYDHENRLLIIRDPAQSEDKVFKIRF